MTLTTHAIVGAAIVSIMPTHPILSICAAFASHFLIDAIPHYDYQVRSVSLDPRTNPRVKITFDHAFFLDMCFIGTDLLLGIPLALLLFTTPSLWLLVVLGALAGMLPDPLQFVWSRWKHEPLNSLQRFHKWIHTRYHLREHPTLGAVSQFSFVVLVVAIAQWLQ